MEVKYVGILPGARLSRSECTAEIVVGTPVTGAPSLGGVATDLLRSGDLTLVPEPADAYATESHLPRGLRKQRDPWRRFFGHGGAGR